MKILTTCFIGALSFFFNLNVYADKEMWNLQQFRNLDQNDSSIIQWNFQEQTGDKKYVELRSSACFNNDTKNHGISTINVLFNTETLLETWGKYEIGFKVWCHRHTRFNENWRKMYQSNTIFQSLAYTQLTMNVGKCHITGGSRDVLVENIEILVRTVGSTNEITLGEYIPSPYRDDKCARIDNFKTIYISSITGNPNPRAE